MLLAVVVVIAILFLLPKKGGKFPSISSPLPQRDADRKEALDLIEAKLVEADKQNRFNEAVTVISGLAESKKVAK
jgi:hypothetical protein